MSNDYETLLNATVEHLQNLRAQGVRSVAVDPLLLQSLSAPAPRSAPRPAPTPASQPMNKPAAAPVEETITLVAPVAPQPTTQPLSAEEKDAAMAELRCRALQCVKCPHLVSSRKNIVFGVGTIHTELMFVGEAPGADEDAQGEPFVGAAGQLLTKIIQTMGFSRETVYIANVLKCRPDTPGQSYGNRRPTPDEMKTCLPYLLAQIDIIRPKVVVALGAVAMEGLFGKPVGIMKLRGNWQSFRDIPVMPTYHPAYLLRNQAMSEKRKVWEDMLEVLERLGRPITDKQRGYFLRAA